MTKQQHAPWVHRDLDLEGLNAQTKVQTVWHNNAQHRLVTSAYNPGVRSALVVPLRQPAVLGAGAAASGGEERAALEAQIQQSEQVQGLTGNPSSACGGVWRSRELFARDEHMRGLATSVVLVRRPCAWGSAGFDKSQAVIYSAHHVT